MIWLGMQTLSKVLVVIIKGNALLHGVALLMRMDSILNLDFYQISPNHPIVFWI